MLTSSLHNHTPSLVYNKHAEHRPHTERTHRLQSRYPQKLALGNQHRMLQGMCSIFFMYDDGIFFSISLPLGSAPPSSFPPQFRRKKSPARQCPASECVYARTLGGGGQHFGVWQTPPLIHWCYPPNIKTPKYNPPSINTPGGLIWRPPPPRGSTHTCDSKNF